MIGGRRYPAARTSTSSTRAARAGTRRGARGSPCRARVACGDGISSRPGTGNGTKGGGDGPVPTVKGDATSLRRRGRRRTWLCGLALLHVLAGSRGYGQLRVRGDACQRRAEFSGDATLGGWEGEAGAVRYGEARHPGPVSAEGGLPCEWAAPTSGLRYPAPHRDGFRSIATPGFGEDAVPRAGDEPYSLTFETVNTTGWKGLKKRIKKSRAHVLLVQETWVDGQAMSSASRWALGRGWKSVWTPAERTAKGGLSAGTAVLARDWLGLRYPPKGGHQWHGARVCAAVVDAPGYRPCLAVAAYCHHGQRLAGPNLALLADVGAKYRALGNGWSMALGGDFNMSPSQLVASGFPAEIAAQVVATANPRGTCRTRLASNNFDYFVLAGEVADVFQQVATVEASGNRTHTPVQLRLHPRAAALKALHLRPPPRLPTERLYGPLPLPSDWRSTQELMEETVCAARSRPRAEAEAILAAAYALWAYRAEEELADATGHKLPKRGLRSGPPQLAWRSILPEARPPEGFPSESVLTWLRDLTREALRAARPDAAAADLADAAETVARALREDMPGGTPCARVVRAHHAVASAAAMLAAHGRRGHRQPSSSDARVAEAGSDAARLGRHCDGTNVGPQLPQAAVEGAPPPPLHHLQQTLDAIDFDLKEQEKEDGAAELQKWRTWLREDAAGGAAHAHAYSRLQDAWNPTEVVDSQGILTADPGAILESQRDAYASKWQAAPRQTRYAWRQREALPRLTPAQLRDSSSSFSRATASTYDGFHPRHFGLLSDAALAALGAILEAVELLGAWPSQVDLVVMPLLPKPKGGYRPIGLLAGIYRLWSKARRAVADDWEAQHQRPYFAASAGYGPLDAVWRQAVRQEAGVAQGCEAAAVMEDMASFYELMSRGRLMAEAEALGFPGPVLRASLAAYAAPRVLAMRGRISREVFPKVGVIAGCSLATTYVRIYYVRPYDTLALSVPPSIDFNVYIDDTVIMAEGEASVVAPELAKARAKFIEMVKEVLGGEIAVGKTGVVASSRSVAVSLKALCGIGGPVRASMEDLGVDYTAGASRGHIRRGAKRHQRAQRAQLRRRRLSIIQAVIGDKSRKVYTAGIAPAAAYDAPVWGLTDREVLTHRRLAAVTMRPRGRGRSLTITNLIHDAPTARLEVAPVLQYARAVWRAVTAREAAAARGSGLPDINRWWTAAAALYADAVKAYGARDGEGDAAPPDKRLVTRAWRSVRGPVGSAVLSLARIGWRFVSAFLLRDDRGVEVTLTHTTPSLLKDLLVAGVRRHMERQAARRWAQKCPAYEGRRLCLDLAVAALRPRASIPPLGRGAYRASVCGAIMTRSRAAEGGYEVDPDCAQCGEARDTVHHRIYGCRHSAKALEDAVPKWFIQEAKRADASDPFWVTGAFPHPADLAPLPEPTVRIIWDYGPGDEGRPRDGGQRRFGGNVFFDGSCKPCAIRDLSRAGGATVMTDDEGRPLRRAMAAVPAHLPQTAQAAENIALAVTVRALEEQAVVKGDCRAVVNSANAPCQLMVAARRKYGGLVMDTLRDPDKRRWAGVVEWVPAHRKLTGAEDAATRRDICGNDAADAAAKEARESQPGLGQEVEARAEYYLKRAPLVAKAAAATLPLFPPAPGDMQRRPKPSNTRQAVVEGTHLWEYKAGAWRCAICAGWTRVPPAAGRGPAHRCPGPQVLDSVTKYTAMGHAVCRTQGELPIIFCSRCGSWAARRAHGLSAQCQAPTAAGRLALRRIEAGLHPWRKRAAGGGEQERTRLRTVAAFDRAGGKWKRNRDAAATADEDDMEQDDLGLGQEDGPAPPPPKRPRRSVQQQQQATPDPVTVAEPAAAADAAPMQRDPRLAGTSMKAIVATLRRVVSRSRDGDDVLVFNATTGCIVKTRVGALEAERSLLQAEGVHDDAEAVAFVQPRPAQPCGTQGVVVQGGGTATAAEAASPARSRGTEESPRPKRFRALGGPATHRFTDDGPSRRQLLADLCRPAEHAAAAGGATAQARRGSTKADLAEDAEPGASDATAATPLLPLLPGQGAHHGSRRLELPRLPPRPPDGRRLGEPLGGQGGRAQRDQEAPLRALPRPPVRAAAAACPPVGACAPAWRTSEDSITGANRARGQLLATLITRARTSDVAEPMGTCAEARGTADPGSDVILARRQECVKPGGTSAPASGGPDLAEGRANADRDFVPSGASLAALRAPRPGGADDVAAVGDAVSPYARLASCGGAEDRSTPPVADTSTWTPAESVACNAAATAAQDGAFCKRRRVREDTSALAASGGVGLAHSQHLSARAPASGIPAGAFSAGTSADAQPAR